jgi:hypothetical protein
MRLPRPPCAGGRLRGCGGLRNGCDRLRSGGVSGRARRRPRYMRATFVPRALQGGKDCCSTGVPPPADDAPQAARAGAWHGNCVLLKAGDALFSSFICFPSKAPDEAPLLSDESKALEWRHAWLNTNTPSR